MYQGDIRLGQTIEWTFTTRQFSTGEPFTLAGTPSLEAYQVGSSTPITSGITLTVDYSGVTGLNHVSLVASGGNGFATAKDISVVIAAGTVDGVSVVGETIGSFSIENRSAVMPATAGRTLDVDASGRVTVGAIVNGAIAAATFAANAITSTVIADGALTAAKAAAGFFDAVWSVATRILTAATNITSTGGTTATQTGDSFARLGAPTGASVSADIAAVNDNVSAVGVAVLTRATPAQVRTEAAAAIYTDTAGEPTGVPPAVDSLGGKVGRLHMVLRNGLNVDANTGEKQFLDDGGNVEWKKDFTDGGGVYAEGEAAAP